MRPDHTANDTATAPADLLTEVIGMWQVKHRLLRSVVSPLRAFAAGDDAVVPPTGVLLHGPEGCGVDFIARRLAEHLAEAVDVHLVVDLDHVSSSASGVVDAMFEPADDSARSFVVATSHRPWLIPEVMFGRGRIDRMALVPPPDRDARQHRWDQILAARGREQSIGERLLDLTVGWTSLDMAAYLDDRTVAWSDHDLVVTAAVSREPAVLAWLTQARSLAVFAQHRGMVDDLVAQLQRYRLN